MKTVGELLRASGRARLGDDRLELFLPEVMWEEQRTSLRLAEPEREVRGAGIASMFPEHGVKVVVDAVRP